MDEPIVTFEDVTPTVALLGDIREDVRLPRETFVEDDDEEDGIPEADR